MCRCTPWLAAGSSVTSAVARRRPAVDQLHVPRGERGQRRIDVGRVQAQVMETLAALGEEARGARRRVQRLEQLDLRVAAGEKRRAHPLVGDDGLLEERKAE